MRVCRAVKVGKEESNYGNVFFVLTYDELLFTQFQLIETIDTIDGS